ncbi:MAG: hypothetical protein KBF88_16880, partial [Polyangiaceae bacterium]|nr:hypothetical protein [Polyangiaceae bacterium]
AGTPEAPPPAPDAAPPPVKKMSFFVTSVGSANGGNLGGLVGADTICQSLATAAGVGNRTWQAYLSTDVADGVEVNAKDRIGTGPWYNAKDELIANDVAALHANGIVDTKMLDEKGVLVVAPVLTSTNADGTAATENCMNWTAVGDGNTMRVGYTNASSSGSLDDAWNTDPTPVTGCSAANFAAMNLGRFYCFAIN